MASIAFDSVSKTYSRQSRRFLWRFFLEALGRRRADPFYALRNLSFRLTRGESLAVIGHNGAGKTTVLNLVAGLTVPEEGAVRVEGRVTALMDLGAGFHGDLTGHENLRVNAALLGYSRKQVESLADRIVEFAGLRDFITEPLRTWSQGMVLRLAFSVAVHSDPEILLVDEVLAVGDQDFQRKCHDRILEMKRAGVILLCVSHAAATLEAVCDRALWIESGRLIREGPTAAVLASYQSGTSASLQAGATGP